MDKCTFCSGGPEPDRSEAEFKKYGRNRLSEGKLPACAEMCSTKALLGGDGDVIADIYRQRVTVRGKGSEVWGWGTGLRQTGGRGATGRREQVMSARTVVAVLGGARPGRARRLRRAAAGRGHLQAGQVPGQADTRPWDNAPLAYGNDKWTQGNKTTWEDELKGRTLNQNENTRIGQ